MTMPSSRPPATSARSCSSSSPITSRRRVQRRASRQLGDHVALGRGDRELGPDGRGALRDAGQHLDARQADAHRAGLHQLPVQEQRRGALRGARARQAAEHRDARIGRRQRGQGRLGREGVGVGRAGRPPTRPPDRGGRAARAARRSPRRSRRRSRWWRRAARRPRPPPPFPPRSRGRPPARRPRRSPPCAAGAAPRRTPSRVASGAARWCPAAKTSARSARAPPSPAAAAWPASIAPTRASACVESPAPMEMAMDSEHTPDRGARTPHRALRADRRRQDRRRGRARRPAARRAASDPVAVSADALQVYEGLEIAHRRRHARASAPRSSTAWSASCPSRRALQRRRSTPSSRTPRSTTCWPRGRARSSSAGPASTCARRWPSSTCARRRPRAPASAGPASCASAAPAALHAELARAGSVGGARRSTPTDSQRIVRSLELLDAGRARAARRGRPLAAVDRRDRATRRCWPG